MRSVRPGRKEDDVPRFELLLAAGMAQRWRPGDDQQPFLAWVLVVVGADRLPGREFVDAESGECRAERRPDTGAVALEAVRQWRTPLALDSAEVHPPNRVGT